MSEVHRPAPGTASAPSALGRPAIAEQLWVGFATAWVAAIADVIVCAARAGDQRVSVTDFASAALHLVALYLPLGVLAGLVAGIVLRWLRAAPWTAPVRARLGLGRRLLAPDPEAFATGLGLLAGAGTFLLGARVAALHFATRYHDEGLAAWAMATAAVGLMALAVIVVAAVSAAVRPAARRMGRLASTGAVALLAVVAIATVAIVVALRAPRLLYVVDPLAVGWIPGIAVTWVLVTTLTRVWQRRGSRAAVGRRALVAVLLTLVGLLWCAATYGDSNRVRAVVEQRAIAGLWLVRGYARASDRDGDGHSFAFGGRDCDDGDPTVHPGAIDPPGDGVDADCFDGDGSREVAAMGDGAYGTVPAGVPLRPNFLLVGIDALRPDHIGCYGYRRPTSPTIDRLCAESIRFEDAVAQSSRSIRSIPSMFTGMYPSQIAFGDEYLFPALKQENVTLAEILSQHGYVTAVTMGTDYFSRTAGFLQGFEIVNQIPIYKPPRERPVDDALAQLDELARRPQPFFQWVHLFNVHEEYLWDRRPSRFGDNPVGRYDTEIALADAQVARLLERLEERGLADRTVVILFSDHGEAFGEHNNRGHSFTLYEEELRSALMLRVPGLEPRVVPHPVGLMDLTPTVLNLARIPMPRPVPAVSLVPLMTGRGEPQADRLMFAELMPDGLYPFDQKAIRRGDMKLLWWVREGTFQLFDLERDGSEQSDLSDDRLGDAEELLGLLRAWVAQTNRPENRYWDVIASNRLPREPSHMTRRLDLRYRGLFTVLGFDMPRTRFEPGERIPMTFYYRVEGETDRNLFFYVNIEGPPGYPVPPHFHSHHYPMNGRYGTPEWRAGEILRDPVEMIIPEDIRHPVTLHITLSVLDGRTPLPFDGDTRGDRVFDLAQVEIP